ncbi:MAG TPA: hypothetical protein VGL22_14595 [Terracidiphilus sp.]|jgi:hypothetical protein
MANEPFDTGKFLKTYWWVILLLVLLAGLTVVFRTPLGIQLDQKTILVLSGAAVAIAREYALLLWIEA